MTHRAPSILALAFAAHLATGCIAEPAIVDDEGTSDEVDDELKNTEKNGKPWPALEPLKDAAAARCRAASDRRAPCRRWSA